MIFSERQEQVAVLLIAHGSRHAMANDDLHQLTATVARQGAHPIVEACFLELAAPDIAAGGDRCVALGASRVLMIPYFLSAGVHLLRDLTAARDALAERHPAVDFRLGQALGPHSLLEELVAVRVRELETGASPQFPSSSSMAERYAPLGGHEEAPSS